VLVEVAAGDALTSIAHQTHNGHPGGGKPLSGLLAEARLPQDRYHPPAEGMVPSTTVFLAGARGVCTGTGRLGKQSLKRLRR